MAPKYTPGYKPPTSYLQFNGDGTVTPVGGAWKENYPRTMAGKPSLLDPLVFAAALKKEEAARKRASIRRDRDLAKKKEELS